MGASSSSTTSTSRCATVDNVRLVLESDGAWRWHCEKCGMANSEPTSHLGFVYCQTCLRSSFVTEVVR